MLLLLLSREKPLKGTKVESNNRYPSTNFKALDKKFTLNKYLQYMKRAIMHAVKTNTNTKTKTKFKI